MTATSSAAETNLPMGAIGSLMPTSVAMRSVDRELLLCLRGGQAKTIGDLTEMLGVTATAVRQRVERLLESGLIARERMVAGRGRPTYRYLLTVQGYRRAGADAADLAEAMWQEILALPDGEVRQRLVESIALRLGGQLAAEIHAALSAIEFDRDGAAPSFAQRMHQLSSMLQSREIPAEVRTVGDLPVLDIEVCPYPSLTDASSDRAMCRLEELMLSEALGETVRLSSCRLDGDACCQFKSQTQSQP